MGELERKIFDEFQRVSGIENAKNPTLDGCIMDGLIDESAYGESKYKCCFILKEAYDDISEDKIIGGGWSFRDILKKWDNNKINRHSSLARVSALVYSINHGFCDTAELTSKQLKQGFASCYWINLSKTPARTSTSNGKAFIEKVHLWSQMVQYQLVHANPDILIFGNTWDSYYFNYPYNELINSMQNYPANSVKPLVRILRTAEGKIQVDAYHPGRKQMDYERGIISSLRDYLVLN